MAISDMTGQQIQEMLEAMDDFRSSQGKSSYMRQAKETLEKALQESAEEDLLSVGTKITDAEGKEWTLVEIELNPTYIFQARTTKKGHIITHTRAYTEEEIIAAGEASKNRTVRRLKNR